MTGLVASVIASLAAWPVEYLLSGHVSDSVQYTVSFIVLAVVFVPSYVWIKRLREGL
jgi:ABC-type thiamin/hydroxymethylpyrimidine transport system permease subunit